MAKQMIDLLLDSDDDVKVIAGDFIAGECTAQNQLQLILNNKGDFKQYPTVCVGIPEYMDDEGLQSIVRAISIEFARDGMEVVSIKLGANGTIDSDAYYA